MRRIKYSLLILPSVVLLTLAFCFRQETTNGDNLSSSVVKVLQALHYEPKQIDDDFSKTMFKLYLDKMDGDKRFFLANDIDSLERFQTEIDNQILANRYEFLTRVNSMFDVRVGRAEKWYKEILSQKFDFSKKEDLDYDAETAPYLKTEAELKDYWRKSIKRQVLERYVAKLNKQTKSQEANDSGLVVKHLDTLEAESRSEVLKTHNNWFNAIRKNDSRDRMSQYINCITEIFDPHTNYFPPIDKENFDIRMSGKLEGIGAALQERDGDLKVMSIVPGSPSYKQGELKGGDIILKVAQGANEPVDVTNMKIDDAIQLIRGPKGTEVRLTIKKPDGSIVIIPIIRDVVEMEDSYAKSAIIKHNGKNYGYIMLPAFYLDMNGKGGRSSSADIEEELKKLKKEDISGIILDLRNNGGGSLSDVVDIAGLFIPQGPVTKLKGKGNSQHEMNDSDPKVLWDGPLTIMVNENSASASEILAAAMQDYRRALIIGTPTFGKGTVQRFQDLSAEMGALKITIQKFYRINGTTTQLKGVVPDVIIPDRYRYLDFGERDNEFALKSDKISKSRYSVFKGWEEKLKKSVKLSEDRISKDPRFIEIDKLAKRIKDRSEKTKFTLNIDEYQAELKESEEMNKAYDEVMKNIEELVVETIGEDEDNLKDETAKKVRADWNKAHAKDIYIKEAVNVLNDLN